MDTTRISHNCHRGLIRFFIFAMIWLALTGKDTKSWIFGIPAIITATYLSLLLASSSVITLNFSGVFFFIPFFLLNSLFSGVDVMRRALSPGLSIKPGLLNYQTSLPAGPARIFFVNTISMLPGTLSADIQDDTVTVHVIDKNLPNRVTIRKLEGRIAFLFNISSHP